MIDTKEKICGNCGSFFTGERTKEDGIGFCSCHHCYWLNTDNCSYWYPAKKENEK